MRAQPAAPAAALHKGWAEGDETGEPGEAKRRDARRSVVLSWPGAAHASSAGGSPTRTERPVNVRYGGVVIRTPALHTLAPDQPHDPQREFDTSPQNV